MTLLPSIESMKQQLSTSKQSSPNLESSPIQSKRLEFDDISSSSSSSSFSLQTPVPDSQPEPESLPDSEAGWFDWFFTEEKSSADDSTTAYENQQQQQQEETTEILLEPPEPPQPALKPETTSTSPAQPQTVNSSLDDDQFDSSSDFDSDSEESHSDSSDEASSSSTSSTVPTTVSLMISSFRITANTSTQPITLFSDRIKTDITFNHLSTSAPPRLRFYAASLSIAMSKPDSPLVHIPPKSKIRFSTAHDSTNAFLAHSLFDPVSSNKAIRNLASQWVLPDFESAPDSFSRQSNASDDDSSTVTAVTDSQPRHPHSYAAVSISITPSQILNRDNMDLRKILNPFMSKIRIRIAQTQFMLHPQCELWILRLK
eukprot:TRINITY_DN6063_c0_g1_i1.p1 TRINITY_DN6063_c0_g1~~TRINITY_DN6063_c0_g1_i1.p1  ORF type:complete len:372 (+),score=89.45 TRINITY_DN6063_c0_g1_i1:578-1693(+)